MSDYKRGEERCDKGLRPEPDQPESYYSGYGHKYAETENITANLTENEKVIKNEY